MRALSLAGCLFLTLPLLPYDGRSQTNPASADAENKAYDWFDTLGFPDLRKCKLVRVAAGETSRGGEQPSNKYLFAFLVSDDGSDFTVFSIDLKTRTYTRTAEDTPEASRVGFDDADLKREAEVVLKRLQEQDNSEMALKPFGVWYFGQGKEVFVLARACACHGHTELAHALFEEAQKRLATNRRKDRPLSLQQQVSDEIASELLKEAVRKLGDPGVPRKAQLARFEIIVKNYPQGGHIREEEGPIGYHDRVGRHSRPARAAVALLSQMIAEDAARASRPAKAEKDMTKTECINELIFQLRDQQGSELCFTGRCDIFRVLGPGGLEVETPARKLVALEYDAVPQLLSVLNDKRFSRAIEHAGRWSEQEKILRVGDCAYAILERIAGRGFSHSHAALADEDDKEAAARKQKVEAWWKDFQTKGEKRMLVEGAEAGDWDSSEQATRLMLRHPEVAFDAIAKGIRNAREEGPRSNLIIHLGRIFDNRVAPLLRAELKGPFLRSRVIAARTLLRLRHEDAVDAMIGEWRGRLTKKNDDEGCNELVEFLAFCNRLDAINALSADLRKRPIRERFEVIDAFGEYSWERLPKCNVIVLGAIERLLVEELDDTEAYANLTLGRGGKDIKSPRMCDIAGHVLSHFWDEPDSFDLSGSLKVRDRQRLAMQNKWRLPRGLPILPLPAREYDK